MLLELTIKIYMRKYLVCIRSLSHNTLTTRYTFCGHNNMTYGLCQLLFSFILGLIHLLCTYGFWRRGIIQRYKLLENVFQPFLHSMGGERFEKSLLLPYVLSEWSLTENINLELYWYSPNNNEYYFRLDLNYNI